ncbi:MAG: hypothetical protein U0X39_07035 [Bacteroidales bacterium]
MKKILTLLVSGLIAIQVGAQENRTDRLQNLEKGNPGKSEQAGILKSASRLFGAKDDLTTVVMVIPAGSEVKLLESDSTYYHVIFNENEGYVLKRHIQVTAAKATTVEPVTRQNANQGQVDNSNGRVANESRFSYLERKYGKSMAARLMAGKIWKGMTSQMVQDSWGVPQKINRSGDSNIVKEEWIYRNTWLYIENNTLTDWGPIQK